MEEWRQVAQAVMDDLAKSSKGSGCILFIIPPFIIITLILFL
jgi:hypothetical protein